MLAGYALSLACAMVYGAVYTASELVVHAPDYPGPRVLASRVGGGIVAVCAAYIAVAVAPRWGEVGARIREVGRLSPAQVVALYAALSLSSAGHSFTYYRIVAQLGAAATGLLSSLRAVGVFLVSHPLFCATNPAQCLTPGRGVSSAVVIAGVLLFSGGAGAAGGKQLPQPPAGRAARA